MNLDFFGFGFFDFLFKSRGSYLSCLHLLDLKQNKYYAYLKNSSTPVAREIHFGEEITGIKAFYAVVKMSNDVSTDFGGEKQLFQVGSEYSFNNGY